MSDKANPELSKQLYELSGWWDDDENGAHPGEPYYCLGYLLRKLPHFIELEQTSGGYEPTGWSCRHIQSDEATGLVGRTYAKTPEDATALLAIELIKQGVLRPNTEPISELGQATKPAPRGNKEG